MLFEKKSLPPPKRVCLRLKECREERGLTLSDIERSTRISKKYLEALEQCRFTDLPTGTIYQKNIIKQYAHALGVESDKFLDQFLAEETPRKKSTAPHGYEPRKRLSNTPFILRAVMLGTVIGIFLIYLGFQVKQSIDPPRLALFSPEDGLVTSQQAVSIQGETEHETQVSINGQSIVTENNGGFKEQLYLSPGINTIVVSAKRKHGKTTTATRHVILKENTHVSLNR